MVDLPVHAAVKALIVRKDKFLAVQDAHDGYWELPGGKIQYGETPQQALVREVKEELGVIVEVGKPVGMCWSINDKRQVMMTVFTCNAQSYDFDTTKNPADEHIGQVRFVTKEEFLTKKYSVFQKNLKELIKEVG